MGEEQLTKAARLVKSTDGIHTLAGVVYTPPKDTRVRGLLQIVHGMTEHIARYDAFMSFLAERGYIVFGYDHIGHGRTAKDDSELGFFAPRGGDALLVEDVYAFGRAVRDEHPKCKWFLMGHSMGSFIARVFAQKYGEELEGLIISGTGGPNPLGGVGVFLGSLTALFRGKRHISPFLENMAFGKYNEKTAKETPYDWLTHDKDIISAYAADPFCTFHFTTSALCDLFRLNNAANSRARCAAIPKQLPIYVTSGEEDPVGNYGDGVIAVCNLYRACGISDLTMKLWRGCRHEILNETCRSEVYTDLLNWLNKHQ